MSKAERTRQYIIEKTAPLFNTKGFEATSLADLQEATGLTKGSIYGNFTDKEEIAREAFLYSIEKVKGLIHERINRHTSARDKLVVVLNFFSEYVFTPPIPGGCPLLNSAIEADDYHTSMKENVSGQISSIVTFIARLIDEGKRNGEFRKETKSMEIAYVLFSAVEGALMISRVSSSDVAMKAVVKHGKSILDLIKK